MKKVLLVTFTLTNISMFGVWPFTKSQIQFDHKQTRYYFLTPEEQKYIDTHFQTKNIVDFALTTSNPKGYVINQRKFHDLHPPNQSQDLRLAILARHDEALKILKERLPSLKEGWDFVENPH